MARRYVSGDSVSEILARLPVKSLIRFKCVCKMWSAIIRNRSFVVMHLNRSSLGDDTLGLLVSLYRNGTSKFYVNSDDASLGEPLLNVNFGDNMQSERLQVIGCCHGLVCLYQVQQGINGEVDALNINIFLWNPATREFRSLPKSSLDPPHQMALMCYIGFGFDSKSNDYKVVKTLHFEKGQGHKGVFYVEIYTLSTGSWKNSHVSVPYFYNQDYQWDGYTYVNGFFHWPAIGDNHVPDERIMVSFDMADELFQITQMPRFPRRKYHRLFPLKDSVALITESCVSTPLYIDLWVLKEFPSSNNQSWTHEIISIGHAHARAHVPSPLFCLPLGFWKNGQFILQVICDANNQPLLLYDHTSKQFMDLHIVPLHYFVDLQAFRESLVSVYGSIIQ